MQKTLDDTDELLMGGEPSGNYDDMGGAFDDDDGRMRTELGLEDVGDWAGVFPEGVHLYSRKKFGTREVVELLLTPGKLDASKVCVRAPPGPPGAGEWTFVVDLARVSLEALADDDISGGYKTPHSKRIYYRRNTQAQVEKRYEKINQSSGQPPYWDICCRALRAPHPGTPQGEHFWKYRYYLTNNVEPERPFQYAVVVYDCSISSAQLRPDAKVPAKRGPRPMAFRVQIPAGPAAKRPATDPLDGVDEGLVDLRDANIKALQEFKLKLQCETLLLDKYERKLRLAKLEEEMGLQNRYGIDTNEPTLLLE